MRIFQHVIEASIKVKREEVFSEIILIRFFAFSSFSFAGDWNTLKSRNDEENEKAQIH